MKTSIHINWLGGALALASITLLSTPQAQAAGATWDTDADGDWSDGINWTPTTAPGATSGTTNTDIATFGKDLSAGRIINVDANRNIGGIVFDYTPTGGSGYKIRNGSILLSNGGSIISQGGGTSSQVDQIQDNTVYIQGDGGSATFSNTGSRRLTIQRVAGVSTLGKTTTLYLDGDNQSSNEIDFFLYDNRDLTPGMGKLAVVKNGTGLWRLKNNNANYSGGTTLNNGILGYDNSGAFGTGDLTLNGGILRPGSTTDFTVVNQMIVGGDFTFEARKDRTSAFSGNMDLGGGDRTITVIPTGSGHIGANAIHLSGVISNGGLTKAGGETLSLDGANTYTGNTTVSAGTLILAQNSELVFDIGANGINNAILGSGTIQLDGIFKFDLSGAAVADGNSWNIVNVGTLNETYGGTFSVDGFTNDSGVWTKVDGLNTWTFTQSSGDLGLGVVPEPGSLALVLIGLGAAGLARTRRRRD